MGGGVREGGTWSMWSLELLKLQLMPADATCITPQGMTEGKVTEPLCAFTSHW